MKINCAHLRDRSTTGGWIDFIVFDAKSGTGTNSANDRLLQDLTLSARKNGLKVDKSALAFTRSGRTYFYGSPDLVKYLSNNFTGRWTHTLEV